jgi:hypothetical protein
MLKLEGLAIVADVVFSLSTLNALNVQLAI